MPQSMPPVYPIGPAPVCHVRPCANTGAAPAGEPRAAKPTQTDGIMHASLLRRWRRDRVAEGAPLLREYGV